MIGELDVKIAKFCNDRIAAMVSSRFFSSNENVTSGANCFRLATVISLAIIQLR